MSRLYLETKIEQSAAQQAHSDNKPDDQGWGRDNRPIINVSWNDAQDYINWLTEQNQYGLMCRLPSSAEWEYAARAGTKTKYFWGDDIGENNANCDGCGSKWDNKETAPVASFNANKFGLYDMHGNVFEWVQDCYHDSYKNAPKNGTEWKDKECDGSRALRGGAWGVSPGNLRSAYRFSSLPDDQYFSLGFRVVCLPPSAEN